jgi:hypothetical protein
MVVRQIFLILLTVHSNKKNFIWKFNKTVNLINMKLQPSTLILLITAFCFSCGTKDIKKTETVKKKEWHTVLEWREKKYGGWGGPGVAAEPGPMDTILLKDYAPRSSVVNEVTLITKAKYPAIDCHVHIEATTTEEINEWIRTMDEVGIVTSVILTGATGNDFDKLVDLFLKPYPGRFQLYCGMDLTDIEKPDYSERVVAELIRCHQMGACGVGEITEKGCGLTGDCALSEKKRLHPDDVRLDAFWEKCAELKMPVNLHIGDHPSAYTPLDQYQERTPDYQHFNQFGKNICSLDEQLAFRDHTLEKHPGTIFIACHLGGEGNDLQKLSLAMEKYPNLYLDISARDYEIGRTPRSAAKFIAKYKERIVFGTDMGRERDMYKMWWRLLESFDEYFPGRVWWRYYGLGLPEPVLESLYCGTAKKIFEFKK